MTAVPAPGYLFVGWSGDYSGTENPLTILNVTSGMTITANFEANLPPDKPGIISPIHDEVVDHLVANTFLY